MAITINGLRSQMGDIIEQQQVAATAMAGSEGFPGPATNLADLEHLLQYKELVS